MTAPLPLGLRNPYTPCAPPCTCVQQRVHDAWKEGAKAGARAVIWRMRTMKVEGPPIVRSAEEFLDYLAAQLEREISAALAADMARAEQERELKDAVVDAAVAWYETSYEDVPQDVLEDTLSGAVIRLTAFCGKKGDSRR